MVTGNICPANVTRGPQLPSTEFSLTLKATALVPGASRARGAIQLPPAENFRVLEQVMAQKCEICGKGPQFGNNISHAHNVTKRRWNPNLRPVHAAAPGGNTKRMRVCTGCIKSGKVTKA
jgi:large subunit ribosomal protein L28